jgi:hypothetical protein
MLDAERGQYSEPKHKLTRKWLLDADTEAVRTCVPLDDARDAHGTGSNIALKLVDDRFYAPVDKHSANAARCAEIDAEDVLPAYCTGFSFGLPTTNSGSLRFALRIRASTAATLLTGTRTDTLGSSNLSGRPTRPRFTD